MLNIQQNHYRNTLVSILGQDQNSDQNLNLDPDPDPILDPSLNLKWI